MNHEDWDAHQRQVEKGHSKRFGPDADYRTTREQMEQMNREDKWIFWLCLAVAGFLLGLVGADYLEIYKHIGLP